MGKGTPAAGRHNKEGNHIRCRRCGRHSYHKKHKECASCGFGNSTKLRHYRWNTKNRPHDGLKAVNIRRQPTERRRIGNQRPHRAGRLGK
ncbi:MAG: 50S ribosomal protein L37e [archaeon]|nr:50S ribosomal protein L37e [archaeon]